MFPNVFERLSISLCRRQRGQAARTGESQADPYPGLAPDPAWHCIVPAAAKLCNFCTSMLTIVPGSTGACWLIKLFYFTSLSPIKFIWRHLDICKCEEFSGHLLLFCFCPIWCEKEVTILLLHQARPGWTQLEPAAKDHTSQISDIHQGLMILKIQIRGFPRKMRMTRGCQKWEMAGQWRGQFRGLSSLHQTENIRSQI